MQDTTRISLDRPLITDTATSITALFLAFVSFLMSGRGDAGLWGIDGRIVSGFALLVCAAVPWVVPAILGRFRNVFVRWFRLFYIQIFYLVFFNESIYISRFMYYGRSFDSWFYRLDEWLFGMQPSQELYRMLPDSRFVVELFFAGYGIYFLMFSLGIWALFFRRKEREALEFLSVVTISFYLMYVIYCFFPVMGPKYYIPELHEQWYGHFEGYLFTFLLKRSFASLDLYGAAFPSSHAAISTVSLLMNFKHQRVAGWASLGPTAVLLVSTVYIYAHYAVDIFAGVAVGITCFLLLPRLVARASLRHDRCLAKCGYRQIMS
jgi:membrane-associated phospholipid phosphatase